MKLTAHQHDALTKAKSDNGELRRVHDDKPGKPPYPAPAATLASLVRRGLLDRGQRRNNRGWQMDVWALNDAGREALDPPPIARTASPLYVADGGIGPGNSGYTSNPKRALDRDPQMGALPDLDAWRIDRSASRERHRQDRGRTTPPGNRKAA